MYEIMIGLFQTLANQVVTKQLSDDYSASPSDVAKTKIDITSFCRLFCVKQYCIFDPKSISVCKKWAKSRLFRYCSSQKLQLMNGVFGNPRGWWGVSLASIHHSFLPHIFYAGIWTFLLQIFYFQWLLLMMYFHQQKIY